MVGQTVAILIQSELGQHAVYKNLEEEKIIYTFAPPFIIAGKGMLTTARGPVHGPA